MRHELPIASLGPAAPAMAAAVEACVHCGFCLPACPTYAVLGTESDSPRGRIVLMKEALEGTVALDDALPHVDACLGCLACVTACPSGVRYGELLTPFRALAEDRRSRPLAERAQRLALLATLPHPRRFRAAAALGALARPFRRFLGPRLGGMLELLPARLPPTQPLAPVSLPPERRRARVALLVGCVQSVLAPGIAAATVRVLEANGVEVAVPVGQGCCGALSAHTGALPDARVLARRTVEAFDLDVDAVITNAAGCGSGLHEYPLWLAGEPLEDRARALAARSRDVSAFLHELGVIPPPEVPETRVAYQDACHLAHGQGVREAPRALLAAIPGVRVVGLADDACCGSAGTYNLERPLVAAELGRRKAEAVVAAGADVLASGNVGCLLQIEAHLRPLAGRVPVAHTIEILDRAYRGVPLASVDTAPTPPRASA